MKNTCWSVVCNDEKPDAAFDTFMKLLIPVTNKHAPIKKTTVKTVKSPWIDQDLKTVMVKRDEAKYMAKKTYCKWKNLVTKLNKKKKQLHC